MINRFQQTLIMARRYSYLSYLNGSTFNKPLVFNAGGFCLGNEKVSGRLKDEKVIC